MCVRVSRDNYATVASHVRDVLTGYSSDFFGLRRPGIQICPRHLPDTFGRLCRSSVVGDVNIALVGKYVSGKALRNAWKYAPAKRRCACDTRRVFIAYAKNVVQLICFRHTLSDGRSWITV